MKEIPLPETSEQQAKKGRSLQRICRAYSILTVLCAVLAVALLLGVFVAVIVAEFNRRSATLCYILAGAMGGGALVCALLAVLVGKCSTRADIRTTDYMERRDGENSFFVGDGTLATFEKDSLRIHGVSGEKYILVPYAEIRAFSVCSRTLPREKGAWSVVLEIPQHYLMKEGKAAKDAPPSLVQTDAKERLYRVLDEHGIELIGERRPADMPTTKRFIPQQKYFLPDKKKRSRALMLGGVGLVLVAVGVPVGIFFNYIAGGMVSVFGLFLALRAATAFIHARGMLAFYEEGIYWRETERRESVFLKWQEIERICTDEQKGFPILTVRCPYGAYQFPNIGDCFEYLHENHPDKVS